MCFFSSFFLGNLLFYVWVTATAHFPNFFQEIGEASLFSKIFGSKQEEMLSFFQNFFLGNLLLHLWVRAIFPVSSKNLVKQVYSPRTLDQSRGKCCPFFKFFLGQFACPSLGHNRGKLFQISFKKLVRQVNSPRFLDQTGGNAALFSKFLLGQSAFTSLGHNRGKCFPVSSKKLVKQVYSPRSLDQNRGNAVLFQISSLAICFCIFGSQQGQKFPSLFQEIGEASLFSKIFGSKQGGNAALFSCPFFLIFLLGQFAFPSLGHSRDKICSNSFKKLVRQVYSPRSLDQTRGNAALFSNFFVGNLLFHRRGNLSQFLPRS